MSLYEFQIIDKDGNILATLDGAMDRFFSIYLNKPGEARFTLSPTDTKLTRDLLLLGHKELHIRRAGKLVWGGELLTSRTTLNAQSETIEFAAKGYLDLLSKRVVGTTAGSPVTYTDEDISQIAHDLVTDTQVLTNGDFGITSGLNPTSRNGDRTFEFKNLYEDALMGLSNNNVQNGLDFEITPDKKFNTYYPKKGRQLDSVVFEWGVNIEEFTLLESAVEMANQVIVLGSGEGSSMLTATRNAATKVQETYRLRQKLLYHKDVVKEDTLTEHGDAELAEHTFQSQVSTIRTRGDLPPVFGSYAVGDSVRVKVNRGLVRVDSFQRIYGIEVKVGKEDEEGISLIFNPN